MPFSRFSNVIRSFACRGTLLAQARRFPCGLKKSQSGAVEVEIAVGLTLLIILTMGGFDVGRYILLSQKLDRTVMSTGDLMARGALPDAAGVADIFASVPYLVQPFGFDDNGKVVLSAVSEDLNGDPTVVWQRDSGGDMEADSLLGGEGGEATLPEGLQTLPNENIIVAELFYDYQPLFGMGFTEARRLYHRSFYRTRIE